jgi:hypothetical protein
MGRSEMQHQKQNRHSSVASLLALCLVLLASTLAHAEEESSAPYSSETVRRSKKATYTLQLGARYMGHYVQDRTTTTAPAAYLGEFQANYWFGNTASLYALVGTSVGKVTAKEAGVGFKMPFWSLEPLNRRSFIGRVYFMLDVNGIYYNVQPATYPYVYNNSAFTARYGLSLMINLANKGAFLELIGQGCQFSSNFFIAPSASIGGRF